MNRNLWYNLKDMIEILKLLHNSQIISKSGDVYLRYVV